MSGSTNNFFCPGKLQRFQRRGRSGEKFIINVMDTQNVFAVIRVIEYNFCHQIIFGIHFIINFVRIETFIDVYTDSIFGVFYFVCQMGK